MIKGVLFDYGGVIADGGKGRDVMERLCRHLKLPDTAIDEYLMPMAFGELTRGHIDLQTFWNGIESRYGLSITETQRHTWDDWWGFEPYPEMVKVIQSLQAAEIPVGLLSNIIPPIKDKIAGSGGYDLFDFAVLSCDVGFAKPDPEIYDLAIAQFNGLQSEELVFIDDQQKCLPPAQALGIETILATSSQQIITELRKLDLPV